MDDCIKHTNINVSSKKYLKSLCGGISFALQLNPNDEKMMDCFKAVQEMNKSVK